MKLLPFSDHREAGRCWAHPFHVREQLWRVTRLLAPEELAARFVAKTALFHLGTVSQFIIYEEEHDA